jgi:hypothetical protein
MALTYDQISAITEKKWIAKLYDNIFDSDPLLQRLKKKSYIKKDGGTQIMIPLNYALNNAGGWYSGAETFNTTDAENMTAAVYDWKQLYENISITGRDREINNGDAAILDFVKSKTQIAEKTMIDRMGDALYSAGTDPKSILGLATLVDATDSVGGISGSTYSWWASTEDTTTTTESMSALQTQHTLLTKNNETPTVILGTRTLYNKYYALLQPQQRFQDSETAKGGFTSLMFNGIPYIASSKCTANARYMLNENYLHLVVHKNRDMKFTGFKDPINQDVTVGQLLWMGAFAISNRRMCGKATAITA